MITILSTLLVLGILIFVHELGHFLVAKWVGIRVEKFSLGFPPKLVSFTKGDTEYCISVIPLGGYVKMAGENPDESENTGAPYEFMSKTPLQRSLVIMAGPVMNFITAIAIYAIIFNFQGYPTTFTDKVVVGAVSEDSPAMEAGLLPDDEILSVNGQPVRGFADMVDIVSPLMGEEVTVEYMRGEAIDTVSMVTRIDSVHNEVGELIPVGRLGLSNKVWWEDIGFFGSIARATERTWDISVMLVGHLWKILSMQIPLKAIGGPLFIAEASGQVARLGVVALFSFIAMLSVNLAIVNVLPIPVLDGGHMVFLGVEAVRRRPLTIKQRAAVQQVGLAFLLVLIAMVTYNDFVRMFFG